MLTSLLLLALAAPQGQANPRVVINELQYDDNSTDDYEFLELFNRSANPVDISGWYVEITDNGAPAGTFTVPAATILPPAGYWVMGSALVPNVNQVIGTVTFFSDNNATYVLKDSGGTAEDSVFTEANKGMWAGANVEGPGLWGNHRAGREDNLFSSWSRTLDGQDTNNNGRDFINTTATPGTTNNRTLILPHNDTYDSYAAGFLLPEWGGAFKEVRVTDPTLPANANPNVIPASPQGGLCAIAWDDLGGGNSNQLLSDVGNNFIVEAWVYFDATLPPAAEYEAWSIGAQGTCESFYNLPDPERRFAFTANGNTGVSWTYMRTSTDARLYLIDHNDGGTDFRVLGTINVVPGSNDGWQRLRLQVNGTFVEGRFGGTMGGNDGTAFGGVIDAGGNGGVYIGYREFLVNNGMARPVTFDDLRITLGNAAVLHFGAGAPTTVGVPTIAPNVMPRIDNPGHVMKIANCPALSVGVLVLSNARQLPPIPLSPFGGQPGSQLLVVPTVIVNLGADAQGNINLPLGIPNSLAMVGTSLAFQYLAVDLGLAFPLPIGHTNGVELRFGN